MAEEVQKAPQGNVPQVEEEVVVVADVPQAEKMTPTPAPQLPVIPVVEKQAPPVPETEEEPVKPKLQVEEPVETEVSKSSGENDEKVPESVCFKEESTKIADLSDAEKKGLEELRELVQEALNKHEFGATTPPPPAAAANEGEEAKEAVGAEEEQKPAQEATPASEEEHVKAEPDVAAVETKDEVVKDAKIEMVENEVTEEKVDAASAATDTADDDGAKTVEAIEETIVAVSSSATQEQTLPPEKESEAKSTSTDKEEAKNAISVPPEEVSIWGIPLLADERSDVILLKFLRARDFKVRDAFTMLKNTIQWRKEFGIDELLEQDLGDDLGKAVFMHGFDKEGHPVCYNVYGEFQDKDLYQKSFSDEEKRKRFLRWRIQFLEKSIRKLDFKPGGISTIVQVNDLKNSPGPSKRELRQATKQALQLLQDNYPEFVAKQVIIYISFALMIQLFLLYFIQICINFHLLILGLLCGIFQVFINVPWWYLAVNRMISPFLTQRTRSKFVFASPSKSAATLLRLV